MMRVGVLKEIKIHEYRVGLTPEAAREYVARGHEVLIETGAGAGMGAQDSDYVAVGAKIAENAAEDEEVARIVRERPADREEIPLAALARKVGIDLDAP